MSHKTHIPMQHRVDIYEKTVTENAAGQKVADWTLSVSGQACYFTSDRTQIRVNPTIEEQDKGFVYFPPDVSLTYGTRLKNLHNLYGETLYNDGLWEVISIRKYTTWSGRFLHYLTQVQQVIEQND